MSSHAKHAKGHGHVEAGQEPEDGGIGDAKRRTVDEDVPTAPGLTSPGEGADEAPAEPRQSKDYT
jgi:hypothetical protein